jgi:hypothetical protein
VDDRSQLTVDYFALNDHVEPLDPPFDNGLPLTEDADLLARDWVDPRKELRDRAWHHARTAAEQLAAVPDAQRGVIVPLVRTLAGDSGFWSTWATVLWESSSDPELVAAVLQPPGDATPGPDALAPPHPFPSTRPDWLPPPTPTSEA